MNTFRENVLRVVAVIGLLAVLLLGAWGIIQIAFALPTFFGNLGGAIGGGFKSTPQESLTLSAPAGVKAGVPFNINWAHTGAVGQYSYALSYSCEQGLTLETPVPTGSWVSVACNTPFNYINASSSLPLVAVLDSKAASAHPTFTITATALASGKVSITARGSTVVSPAAATATAKPAATSKPASKPSSSGGTYYASGRTQNLYGYPDLAVSINSAQSQGGNTTVVFTIQNIGTNVSPSNWTFNALLPINGNYTYPSGAQLSLYPGDKIVYTLRYSESNYGNTNVPCSYGNAYPCTPAPTVYGGPGTCNAYGPCNVPGYQPFQLPYPYNPSYNYSYTGGYGYTGAAGQGYGAYGGAESVTVVIDPANYVIESTKANNTATATYLAY